MHFPWDKKPEVFLDSVHAGQLSMEPKNAVCTNKARLTNLYIADNDESIFFIDGRQSLVSCRCAALMQMGRPRGWPLQHLD